MCLGTHEQIVIKGTAQEIYDTVVEHLAVQKVASVDPETFICKYRFNKDGRMLACPIGRLIPDEQYCPALEDITIDSLIDDGTISADIIFEDESKIELGNLSAAQFLLRLQCAHDTGYTLERLKYLLYKIAELYNLDHSKVRLITEWGRV